MIDKNYIGKQYNNLKVIDVDKDENNRMLWLCECQCPNKIRKMYLATLVKNGYIKSCGCLRLEKLKNTQKSRRKYNTYDLTGKYGIGYTSKEEQFYFDLEDYDKIKNFYWVIDKDGYVVTQCKDYSTLRMHRLIMKVLNDKNIEIDHISRIRNDNRKNNLRYCTDQQNAQNRSIQSNNKSGIVGICYNKKNNKWRAYIKIYNKQINLGSYKDINKAKEIRELAENLFFKEFCPRIKNINDFNFDIIKEFKYYLNNSVSKVKTNMGSNNNKAVINEEIAKEIKMLIKEGLSNKEISNKTNVNIYIIKNIKYNKAWKHVQLD